MTRLKAFALAAMLAFTLVGQSHTAEAHQNIVRTAQKAGQFNTLIAAAKAAGLAGVLSSRRGLTVFAPTDAAFAKLGKKTINSLLLPKNRHKLRAILLYHVVGSAIPSRKIPFGRTHVKTLNGKAVAVRRNARGVRVNRSHVVAVDVHASNGVIHVIDKVLIP